MKRNHNLLVALLELLHVRHTTIFSERIFEEHPNKNHFFLGVSQILSEYNIDNAGVKIKNSDDPICVEIEL